MMRFLLNPNDWLSRHQGVCLVCVFTLVLIADFVGDVLL